MVDIPTGHRSTKLDARVLLDMVTTLDKPTGVILDVGAQILELCNVEVAKQLLPISHNDQIQVVESPRSGNSMCTSVHLS